MVVQVPIYVVNKKKKMLTNVLGQLLTNYFMKVFIKKNNNN